MDHILKCSYYNQACDGGYSYLVSKFFNEFEVMSETCFSGKDVKGDGVGCHQTCKVERLNKLKFSVKDFYYVGGSYGKTSEKSIMREVQNNGPIVISLEPDYGFMSYKTGIYDPQQATWLNKINSKKPEWTKVDHSVVLVGWGEEGANKYWILQNSWGQNWGENGFIRLKRGSDQLGIESIGEAAIPIVEELQ